MCTCRKNQREREREKQRERERERENQRGEKGGEAAVSEVFRNSRKWEQPGKKDGEDFRHVSFACVVSIHVKRVCVETSTGLFFELLAREERGFSEASLFLSVLSTANGHVSVGKRKTRRVYITHAPPPSRLFFPR